MNRPFAQLMLLSPTAGHLVRTALADDSQLGESPNVLLISIDDLNDWTSCLGGRPQAKTPSIRRSRTLWEDGLRVTLVIAPTEFSRCDQSTTVPSANRTD